MILLNFSHPLTPAHLAQVEALAGQPLEQVIEIPAQFDPTQPFAPQLARLVATLPADSRALQTLPILVNLPSLNTIAALLLAELHGRMGYFPAVLRMRPVPGSLPPVYEAAEILNLQQIRDTARRQR